MNDGTEYRRSWLGLDTMWMLRRKVCATMGRLFRGQWRLWILWMTLPTSVWPLVVFPLRSEKFQPLCGALGAETMDASEPRRTSFISQIRSHRLAGFVSHTPKNEDIVLNFTPHDPFVVVTGESASGKSLFLVRALELLTGTASSPKSYVRSIEDDDTPSTAFVEVHVSLVDPHASALQVVLQQMKLLGIDTTPSSLSNGPQGTNENEETIFAFRRTLQWVPVGTTPDQPSSSPSRRRFQSFGTVNGRPVPTLKDFFALTRPLFAIVDATVAVNQILSPAGGSCRTQLLDAAVSMDALRMLQQTKRRYLSCRRQRLRYEQELQQQQHTRQFFGDAAAEDMSDRQLQLLSHYITELDGFSSRVTQFCQSLLARPVSEDNDEESMSSSRLLELGVQLSQTTWDQNTEAPVSKPTVKSRKNNPPTSSSFVSKMYVQLLAFRNAVQTMEDQFRTADDVVQALGASSSHSAVAALQRTRKLLVQIVQSEDSNSALLTSTEQIHEHLNQIEKSIQNCTFFIENDDDYGLLPILQNARDAFSPLVTVQYMDALLQEWQSLSRKHNVSPYMLPLCHENYLRERDGTSILATEQLPRARENEREARQAYGQAYAQVTRERQAVAQYLSRTLTETYLPDLGLFHKHPTVFTVDMEPAGDFSSSDQSSSPNTADTTDFSLSVDHASTTTTKRLVHEVASAGERARILLALECALPGAIGAALSASREGDDALCYQHYSMLRPITMVYDEIDSHVGGRAVQSVTRCLLQQSREFQIVAISHNPMVTAAAQTHIIVQQQSADGNNTTNATVDDADLKQSAMPSTPVVSICCINGQNSSYYDERRIQELVRMVGGDHRATNYLEAETFVKSLIRNSGQMRTSVTLATPVG